MEQAIHQAMQRAVVDGDKKNAVALARQLVAQGGDLLAAIDHGYAPGIREVGDLWEEGEYFLPELVQGAEAMKAAMDIINPALAAQQGGIEPKGRVVIGTVKGDLHDIGKTLVGTLLQANGFEVHDLGADVPVQAFLDKAREVGAHLLAASALLTTTMSVQGELVRAAAEAGLSVQVMVGGSPTTPAWAAEIGASFGENAQRAVNLATELMA